MGTFISVDDAALISLIQAARRRVVFIAPGLSFPVAQALETIENPATARLTDQSGG